MIKHYGKKIISYALAAAMVLSGLVFCAKPQVAEAASAGSYKLTITINVTNKADKTGSIQGATYKIYYCPTNGTGSETSMPYDMTNNLLSTGEKNVDITVPGFPTKVKCVNDATWNDSVHYNVTKLAVQGTAGWTGSQNMDSGGWGNKLKSATLTIDLTKPYAKTMTASFNSGSVNCPKTSSAAKTKNTLTYGATDQYGVTMASSLCNVKVESDQASKQVNGSNAVTVTSEKDGTETVSARYGANVKGTTNSQKITATCSWSGSEAKSTTATFTLNDARYTPTFKYYTTNESSDSGTANTETGTATSFGVVPAVPTKASEVTEYHTNARHYTGGHYNLPAEGTGIKTDATYTMVYTSAVHSYEETAVITAPTCTETGMSTFTCTGCTYSYNGETPALGHTWGGWTPAGDHATHKRTCSRCNETETEDCSYSLTGSKEATCTEDGYKTYTCSVCGDSYTEVLNALGHNQSELKIGSNPENGTAGFMYYECQRCAKIFAVGQDGNLDPTQEYDTVEEVMSNANAEIPAPSFNTYVKQDYNYAARGVSLRWANEDDADTTVQATRFTASLQIPVGSQVTDFGYVYTQTKYLNGGVEPENTDNAIYGIEHFTLENVGTAYRVYQQSVYGTASEGNGYTTHDYDGNTVYTFNLVVKIRNKNWQTHYAARAYIKYTYKGHEFIVYDNAYSSRTVYYVSQRVCSEEALEKDIVKRYFNNKVLNFIDPNAYPIIEEPLSE